jgi:hypothetical protein
MPHHHAPSVPIARARPVLRLGALAALALAGLPIAAAAQQSVPLGSLTSLQGTIASGDITSLAADDDVLLVVNSAAPGGKKAKKKQFTDWYASATVPDDTIALRITLASTGSSRVKQSIYLWRWKNSKWKPIDNKQVGPTGPTRIVSRDSVFHYVSSTGELRIRVLAEGKAAFTHSSDLLLVEVLPAGSFPDDDAKPGVAAPEGMPASLTLESGSKAQAGVVRFATVREIGPGLSIYDARGRRVVGLPPAAVEGTRRAYLWTGADERGGRAARGVYFARAILATGPEVQRFVWLRE